MAAALLTGYSLAIADRASKERYEAKIQQIDGVDPYEIPLGEWSEDFEDWPLMLCNVLSLAALMAGTVDRSSSTSSDCESIAACTHAI